MTAQYLHTILIDISHALVIPDEQLKKGKEYMQTIFSLLQNKSRYKLDRCRLVGGVSKKTSIKLKFDYDCVIYVNDVNPPFEKILNEWDEILTLNLSELNNETKVTQHSVQFKLNGFEFDILPARNCAGLTQDVLVQAKDIWNRISCANVKEHQKISRICSLYSSGLSELTLEFMQKQSGFIHDLCRLAKFWNGTILFEQYVSGRSSIIEYIAVKAGQEEEEAAINDKLSMLRAFRRFLDRLVNYQKISIIFFNFYRDESVIKFEKPYLIDPANPYHNFLADQSPHFLPTLAKYSKVTLERLERCEKNYLEELEKLFDPQPDLYSLFQPSINIRHINTIMSISQNCNEKSNQLIVRRKTFDSKLLDFIKKLLAYVMNYLMNINNIKSEEPVDSHIIKAAKHLLNRSLYKEDRIWVPTDKKHEDYDITFVFVLNTAKSDVLYISMTA